MENHVKYNESIYFRGNDGSVYVNLFIPSVLNYKEKGISITQQTNLPDNNVIDFTITTNKITALPIRIRKPKWANEATIKINGHPVTVSPNAEGYLVLNNRWKKR